MDIFEFTLEMKFADLSSIHEKFFLNLRSGKRSVSDWWARERLKLLKQHGFLTAKRISFVGNSYFLATELAHIALTNMRYERSYVRPIRNIDVRSFDHDAKVIEARLALERLGRVTNWVSERRLKSEMTVASGFPRAYQPDAIYQNKHGEPMAFELELAPKTKGRYAEKIRKYVDVIRQAELGSQGFRGVLFVVCDDRVFNTLNDLTRRHDGKFKVEKFNELVAGRGVPAPGATEEVG